MSRTTTYGNTLVVDGTLTKSCLKLCDSGLLTFEISHHKLIIELATLLNELCMIHLSVILHIVGDIND